MSLKQLTRSYPILLIVTAFVVASCAPKSIKKDSADMPKTEVKSDGQQYAPSVDVTEASLRGSEFSSVEGLGPIYFDYDSPSLKPGALEVLKKNAEYLKANKANDYLVAGYCDDRGTTEYNLALGQKRAKEVREYYLKLGVPAQSVATISYGKERPSCAQSAEECWSANRRAETQLRARTVSNSPQRH